MVTIGGYQRLYVWSLAFALHAVSYILFSLRDIIPDVFSIILANILVATMLAIFTEGMYRFEEMRPPRILIWWPVAFIAVAFSLLLDDINTRVAIGSAVTLYQTSLLVWSIARDFNDKAGRGKWIIMTSAMMSTAMFVFRAGMALSGENMMLTVSDTNPLQSITFIGSLIGLVMFAFGLLVIYMERAEQASLRLALHDPLTQLGNRRVLDNELVNILRQKKSQQVSALLMLDLDNFKTLNDNYGHSMGDQLLIEVAYRVKDSVKADDTVIRAGGDEFIVLLTELGTDLVTARLKAGVVANRILKQVAKPYQIMSQFAQPGQNVLHHSCTCSIGVTLMQGGSIARDVILEQADSAMYKAKQKGRDCVVFFDNGAQPK